ncbi:MAG: hypothetical protein KC478_04715 [Bacteriovoracaceae bacterium]|nr:hypothetical protein [Bacteriovoracaceae bacterium]
MKKFLFILLSVFSVTSFARVCYVDLVDRYSSYRYDTFTDYSYNGSCANAIRECNFEKRQRHLYQADCRVINHSPVPGHPGRGIPGSNRFHHLLQLTDIELSRFAQRGQVGTCHVQPQWLGMCSYKLIVNGRGYPHPTGCASSRIVRHRGCGFANEEVNAGCLIRQAIVQGRCR